MLNWWLIVLIVVCSLLCLAIAIYVLYYFSSEDDHEGSYLTKVIIVFGILLAIGVVLLLPFDASNARDPTVGSKYVNTLNTDLMWEIVLWSLAVMALVVVPFTVFFYEAYDPDDESFSKQCGQAITLTLIVSFVFIVITAVCFLSFGTALVPVELYEALPQIVDDIDRVSYNTTSDKDKFEVHVSIFTYVVGELCLVGWIAFFFYAGVGLVSVPVDLIRGFINRPKPISGSTFAQEMAVIAAKGDTLLSVALALQNEARGKVPRSMRNKISFLRAETHVLEEEQEELIWNYKKVGGSPFIVYGKLLIGILSVALSISWVLQIFLHNTFKIVPFLSTLVTALDEVFPLFGIITYGIFAFYLVWITLEGQIRVGLRFVFFQIHPMKPHDTTLNSIVFNVGLLLLTSYAILQFTTRSFNEYIPRTSINALMNLYVMNLKGIGVAVEWAQFCLLGVSFLGLLFVLACPAKNAAARPKKPNYST
ncbi:LMBR1-like membrane protein, putative [Trypanosoma equiperdum]|uniref:LMBR1-like membrane protein n=2 Tax=Trypanozoon TaxID=39700 RepID=Q57XX2_TRYB2|nr:hypothetical protein, conserved [Trypanosoma brucei brucei TREU927]AAX69547.1 hypothetical protein, conserved [Trypanosoma brucei]AAZ10174.1 hypothetical protein, conserved [Trypanosoma brucei brucei TREU927]SCU69916.1 LMBR1-like membrane protein, putative [Trypanosoma equiperdum]